MKKAFAVIGAAIGALLGVCILVFAAIQAVYWLNLDNKLMYALYRIFRLVTARVPRDRRF